MLTRPGGKDIALSDYVTGDTLDLSKQNISATDIPVIVTFLKNGKSLKHLSFPDDNDLGRKEIHVLLETNVKLDISFGSNNVKNDTVIAEQVAIRQSAMRQKEMAKEASRLNRMGVKKEGLFSGLQAYQKSIEQGIADEKQREKEAEIKRKKEEPDQSDKDELSDQSVQLPVSPKQSVELKNDLDEASFIQSAKALLVELKKGNINAGNFRNNNQEMEKLEAAQAPLDQELYRKIEKEIKDLRDEIKGETANERRIKHNTEELSLSIEASTGALNKLKETLPGLLVKHNKNLADLQAAREGVLTDLQAKHDGKLLKIDMDEGTVKQKMQVEEDKVRQQIDSARLEVQPIIKKQWSDLTKTRDRLLTELKTGKSKILPLEKDLLKNQFQLRGLMEIEEKMVEKRSSETTINGKVYTLEKIRRSISIYQAEVNQAKGEIEKVGSGVKEIEQRIKDNQSLAANLEAKASEITKLSEEKIRFAEEVRESNTKILHAELEKIDERRRSELKKYQEDKQVELSRFEGEKNKELKRFEGEAKQVPAELQAVIDEKKQQLQLAQNKEKMAQGQIQLFSDNIEKAKADAKKTKDARVAMMEAIHVEQPKAKTRLDNNEAKAVLDNINRYLAITYPKKDFPPSVSSHYQSFENSDGQLKNILTDVKKNAVVSADNDHLTRAAKTQKYLDSYKDEAKFNQLFGKIEVSPNDAKKRLEEIESYIEGTEFKIRAKGIFGAAKVNGNPVPDNVKLQYDRIQALKKKSGGIMSDNDAVEAYKDVVMLGRHAAYNTHAHKGVRQDETQKYYDRYLSGREAELDSVLAPFKETQAVMKKTSRT